MKITSKIKDYTVNFTQNVLAKRKKVLPLTGRPFFFIDRNVYEIHKEKIKDFVGKNPYYVISALEPNKEYATLTNYYNLLIDSGFTRNDTLVTIGGGILQDISGFIASTLYRGVKWTFLPTPLLAQADSCIGSKTSINFGSSKNLIGTFYPPDNIFIDTDFCKTLTPEYFNSGLGEVIKFHLMSNSDGYTRLKQYLARQDLRNNEHLEKIIKSTLAIKKSYFEADEFDTGQRNLLNYGHCFGHALESARDFAVSHGEAVIIGMGFANLLSLKRGVMKKEKHKEFEAILQKHYPNFDLSKISAEQIIAFLKHDKKRVSKTDLTMILSKDIGEQFKLDDIKIAEIEQTHIDFLKIYPH